MSDLKPCPCCGGEAKEIYLRHMGHHGHRIFCVKCLITTETMHSRDSVVERWNRRCTDGMIAWLDAEIANTNNCYPITIVSRLTMETVTIQIGNSDNKLGQKNWSEFIRETRAVVGNHCGEVHFDGGASFDSPWQNVCIVAEVQEIDKQPLCDALSIVRRKYFQDSTAVTFGQTKLV